jgi:xanthine permease XanP
MRRPTNVIYAVEERPPLGVMALSGLQHAGLMSIYLVYPVLVARAAGAPQEAATALVALTLIGLAIGTVLQTTQFGPVGAGYLCQPIPSVVYLVPSLAAAKYGGLALVFGMTFLAGLIQMAIARVLRNLRPLFPPEIAGLVVLLIGIATGIVGLRNIVGATVQDAAAARQDLLLAAVTLALMVALNVWGRGGLRLFCVLIGMAAGYVFAALMGTLRMADFAALTSGSFIALPEFGQVGWTFDGAMAVPFAVAAVAASLKVVGNVTTCQRASDLDWTRADMRSISRGVLADGLATTIAGGIGAHGLNSSTAAVGLANATGVQSRRVGYAIAIILVVMALVPKLGALLYLMPRPVAGAALIFSSTFIVVNGLEIMASRLLDARKTLVIGLALVLGLAVDVYPAMFQALPPGTQALLGTSLVLGTLSALALNALFRLGMRRTQVLAVPLGPLDSAAIDRFMEERGATWGARRDVIDRAKFNLTQSIEVILESCEPQSPLEIQASFDEFNLDVRVSYDGSPLELPAKRPTNEEIMASDEGQRRLAGFMLRRYADRVAATHRNSRSTVLFHFDH